MTENKRPNPGSIKVRNRLEPTKAPQQEARKPPASAGGRAKQNKPRQGNGGKTENERKEPFLNPYTFVPAFSRESLTGAFADAVPQGHDRLHEENWTGTIAVRLTVRTPLLLLDTARAYNAPDAEEGHLTYPVLLRDGRPHLPATALKGMLRASYEAITNSRFGVFNGHDDLPGWRRVADDARDMKPVRIGKDGKTLELWDAVKLPAYRDEPVRYAGNQPPRHGDHVWVKIERGKNTDAVSDIKRYQEDRRPSGWTEGYVFLTGRNVETKRDERVFVKVNKPMTHKLTEELRERWDALMEHHRKHQSDIDYDGEFAISPHRDDDERQTLTPDTFCWAYMPNGPVEALYPVMIPRELGIASAAEMVPPQMEPATRYGDLSPADRVFGWVAQQGSGTRPAAYRGRLRISDVTCMTAPEKAVQRFPAGGLPLSILAQPKPSQARFYLSENAAEPHRPIQNGAPKNDVHRDPDRALRGRKFYWHHRQAAENALYWTQPPSSMGDPTQQLIDGKLYREYRRPNAPAEERLARDKTAFRTTGDAQRDKQNRSVLGWIAQGTEFTFSIGVRDIPDVELGALLLLLTLDEEHHLRLGLGKPLGFGSIHVSLDPERTKLNTGAQWSEYYRDLTGELPDSSAETVVGKCLRAFNEAVRQQPGFAEIEAAFRATARGSDDLPVHYPRARPEDMRAQRTPPNPAGESFAWFTANEKIQERRVAPGRGRSLPSASAPRGSELDVYNEEKS
ncbi:TIGR03986 family CRISPR-associated RAMP protein [Spirillospora sp. NPDC052269]